MRQPDFGKKVLELRQAHKLTQMELAEKCNVSLRTIQRIEAAEVTPRNYTEKVIFDALGYTPEKQADGGKKWYDIKELFNLKNNTMKKLSVLTLFAAVLFAGIFLTGNALNAQKSSSVPEGWTLAGSSPQSYEARVDKSEHKTGNSSACLGSITDKVDGFGTLMQSCSAEEYLGKRVKMTAWIKSKDVAEWAGMWMRVDAGSKVAVSFDNMQNRPIKGTKEWTKCEIVLDVPVESTSLNFGVLLAGTGKVWFDDISFEVVGDSVKQTSIVDASLKNKPANLDFD